MQRGKAVAVEPLLHAGDALVIDVDVADHVRDFGAVGIDPLVLIEKADPRQALPINLPLLFGREIALQPNKPPLRGQTFAQFRRINIGQIGSEQLGSLVGVDQPARLGE